jgi:hypothetical protein
MTNRSLALGAALLILTSGCGGTSGIAATELAPVVERDGVPFDGSAIPDEVLLRLADYPVVVIGETHLIREQRELTVAIVEGLHAYGYRQLLLEWPHMADWVMSDYVVDGDLAPGWWDPPTWLYGDLLQEIRDFNLGLPAEDRIQVRGIDVNLDNYGGASGFRESLQGLSERLPAPMPLDLFLQSPYDTPDSQTAALGSLRTELLSAREGLVGAWGQPRYDMVIEMVEIEFGSVEIRATWDDDPDKSAGLREQLMKRLADARLAGYEHGSVVNVGGNHAQKKRLKGTDHEWLGDYLVHTSTAPGGPVISVVVVPARVVAEYETDIPDWDLAEASPDNELFKLMSEAWPGQTVFLPFTDPVFVEGDVAMNFEDTIHVTSPERHYDAVVLLPLTHRIPIP